MTHETEIKTLPGGSIDYAHYIARGNCIRSVAAHRGLAAIRRWIKSRLEGVAAPSIRSSVTHHLPDRATRKSGSVRAGTWRWRLSQPAPHPVPRLPESPAQGRQPRF